MSLLIYNIETLVHTEDVSRACYKGGEMSKLVNINDAFLYIRDGKIADFGSADDRKIQEIRKNDASVEMLDAGKGHVFPSWVDSHTHLVFAASRVQEFEDRLNGLSYEEIAARGGGILNSAGVLRNTSEDELFESAWQRLEEIISLGTGAVEIKSGYGLSFESELKMLRVIRRLKEKSPLIIKSTFLGAHAVPNEFRNRKQDYIKLLIHELMPAISNEGLADFCDIFCERNYFTAEDTLEIMSAAKDHGMVPKIHAEQMSHSGGIMAGIASGAISVDHLEFASDDDIFALSQSDTMPVLLPGAQLFLGLPNPPARKMISAGCPVAISSDFNPGSCPSGNMNQMVSLACILYKMTPAEAIIAATSNSAYAMKISDQSGSIARGKVASVFITNPITSYASLPYSFGSNLISKVILNGKPV